MKRILRFLASIAGGAFLVLRAPVVAVGFMSAYIAKRGRNEYESVILGSAAAAVAVILLVNVLELAVLFTALSVNDLFKAWGDHVAVA